MRPYQVEGLNWMVRLHDAGISGILADEMGLGKTMQSISILAYLRESRGINGPHLVVVPKTTLGNWCREFKHWCPVINVFRFYGSKAERQEQAVELMRGQFDVCVTTYEMANTELNTLRRFRWKYLVIDEAHRIKNEKSRLALSVRAMHSKYRLLITGTPLQNNMHELWALLNFLLPELFDSAEDFDSIFKAEGLMKEDIVHKLHTILRPFLLRRLKSDVEHTLKPKIETKLFIGLTEMQREWYIRVLNKDITALNSLGGADRVRLLNILMQLRKVCNHPYLFTGAEPGPPFSDGPHLWENSGKMVLLTKLLPKLRAQGSRVLIFSQMSRMLDILEDYMRLQGHGYCRIDGQTKSEDRDRQMDEFNAPGSPHFAFLLSTRAGGLGINLYTADVVILYDSDWNPQMDLQAQDRAHRIGQKKQVRVFRFITEGTVEEKIVERAERKLFMDAVVIQQGRLVEKDKRLDTGELMHMVKFGADEILRSKGSSITDEDIDALLAKGEERTKVLSSNIERDVGHTLASFKMEFASGEGSMYEFEGQQYKQEKKRGRRGRRKEAAMAATFINLPQRERKRNYDVDTYFREAMGMPDPKDAKERKSKGVQMYDFQFFQKERIEALLNREQQLMAKRKALMHRLKEIRQNEAKEAKRLKRQAMDEAAEAVEDQGEEAMEEARKKAAEEFVEPASDATALAEQLDDLQLTEEEQEEKQQLLDEGFVGWTKTDFRRYIAACERFGRREADAIVKDVAAATGKELAEVERYHRTFWERLREVSDWQKLVERVERGEQKIQRRIQIEKALAAKVARHKNPFQTLSIIYNTSTGKTKSYTEEEDRFLICMMAKLGYGNWDALRLEIRKAWQFRFDWFIKTRTPVELQRRCETLIRLIEKENEEILIRRGGSKARRSSTSKVSQKAEAKAEGSAKAPTKRPRPSASASNRGSASKKKRQ